MTSELILALYGLKEDAAFAWKQALEGSRDGLPALKRSLANTQYQIMNLPNPGNEPTADKSWIMTFSGQRFDPFNPNPDAILIEDIAHALSNICRFTGHVRHHYSVAQHSVLVSKLCSPADALAGLLHDASEAYMNDAARPVKRHPEMVGFRDAENKLQRIIFEKFGLPGDMPASVKRADNELCIAEGKTLNPHLGDYWKLVQVRDINVLPTTPDTARAMFLHRFQELTK